MVYSKRSQYSLDELDTRLREAAQRHKFGVLHVHDLRQTLAGKGIDLGPECRVYDVCNPQAASQALSTDISISTVLPCRISVYTSAIGTFLATVPPTELLPASGVAAPEELANEVEKELFAIIQEAAA
jgi:uncharacterized protein (DUF302 family)